MEKVEELQECSSMGEKQEESMFKVLFLKGMERGTRGSLESGNEMQ